MAPSRPPLQLGQQNCRETDVVTDARSSEEARVRSKFSDIYEVSENCKIFGVHDIENVSDDFSVAGRLSDPKYIMFF